MFINTGILAESELINKKFDGQSIANELMQQKYSGIEVVQRCCVRLYTAESFLYKLVNSTLRTDDRSKLDTLGAYCFMLWYYLYSGSEKKLTLYRGADLKVETIEKYKQAVGRSLKWLAFTSTSKDREVAEIYSVNTLFIIETMVGRNDSYWAKDITWISKYHDEQEVLITGGHPFKVVRVDQNLEDGKYLIYLSLGF